MKKKRHSHVTLHRLRRRRGDSRELAEQLAPLEELLPAESGTPVSQPDKPQLVAQENGAIVVGLNKLTLPEEVADAGDQKLILGLEPVVLVILGLFLAFIVFIAWQVSRMPTPAN